MTVVLITNTAIIIQFSVNVFIPILKVVPMMPQWLTIFLFTFFYMATSHLVPLHFLWNEMRNFHWDFNALNLGVFIVHELDKYKAVPVAFTVDN